jgi:hypothetical protein
MNAVPPPDVIVADVELVKENVTPPIRTLHGVAEEHVAPITSTVAEFLLAARSVSWLAFCTLDPPPPPPLLLSSVQALAAAHP